MSNFDFIETIHDVGLGDCPISVVAAVLKPDSCGKRRIVSGKGTTREEALRSCLAEGVERWCAVFRENCPGVWGTERELAPATLSPRSLVLISNQQYATANEWNIRVSQDHQLPKRRSRDQSRLWVEAKSVTRDAGVLVPAAYCFLGYPHALEQGFPIPDSNGLAAGEDVESCIDHGLLELIERDAVAIWWYGQIRRSEPLIDRSSFELLSRFEAWVAKSGRKLWFLDLATDLGVPVVAALTCGLDGKDLSFGFGAGWTVNSAIGAALGELAQFEVTKRLLVQRSSRGGLNFVEWSSKAQAQDYTFLSPDPHNKHHQFLQEQPHTLAELLKAMERRGLEVIVLDLSEGNQPLSAVRVISPGLRPIWPRFASGRLYDVPVAMKWRTAPLQESQLNSVPILY
jgi:ribosomal protein S12 methylthiotransferase accessory factor